MRASASPGLDPSRSSSVSHFLHHDYKASQTTARGDPGDKDDTAARRIVRRPGRRLHGAAGPGPGSDPDSGRGPYPSRNIEMIVAYGPAAAPT
jgi:hypothetical protein